MGNGCCCCCGSKTTADKVSPQTTYKPTPHHNPGGHRFGDIAITTNDPKKLLEGYEDEPLVSLEEALKPFHGQIDQLPERIKEAKKKCNHSSKHKLTEDESAAIYIYSMSWERTCVYDRLQEALKRGDRAEVKRWFKFIKLFKSGLDKLPEVKGEVWQGTEYNEKKEKLFTSDEKQLFVGLGSCSPSDKDLKQQLGRDAAGRKILIGYGPFVKARDVTGYTANNYPELIVFPGAKVGKADTKTDPDGTVYIHFTRRYIQYSKMSPPSNGTSTKKHFTCPYTSCRNRCPADHEGDHCYTFAMIAHNCGHHCDPGCHKCYNCGQLTHKLCQCYKCGTACCEKCCFR